MSNNSHDSLSSYDEPEWHDEQGYSTDFVEALKKAYHYLKSADHNPDAYLLAAAIVWPFRTRVLSIHQRLWLEFVLAQAFFGENDLELALDHLEEAADIVDFLNEPGAAATIGYEAGKTYHYQSKFASARDCFRYALELEHRLETRAGPAHPARVSELLRRIAGLNWELAEFTQAASAIDEARYILNTYVTAAKYIKVESATLGWIEALIAHSQSGPDAALPLVTTMPTAYSRLGLKRMAGRANSMVAELMLDKAEQRSMTSTPANRITLADKAKPYAHAAIQQAQEVGDRIGEQLGLLVRQRWLRVRGSAPYTITAIEAIADTAKHLQDKALLGRAYMTMGEAKAAQGSVESARDLYIKACHIFEEFEMFALMTWPSRRLLQPFQS